MIAKIIYQYIKRQKLNVPVIIGFEAGQCRIARVPARPFIHFIHLEKKKSKSAC